MDRTEILEAFKDVLVEQLSVNKEDIKDESKLEEDFGADSLDRVEIIMAIEENFGLEIPDEEAEKIKTVGEAVDYIVSKQPQ